jgi:hypothetical protein
MGRNQAGKALLITATASWVVLVVLNASAAGSASRPSGGGSQGGVLASSASPYAILAPATLSNTPGGEGRAAFQGRPSLCHAGEHEIATDFGWRCKAEW